jgi:hypothetical protein
VSTEIDQACEVIEQLMEPCEKCGKIAEGARLMLPADVEITLCQECYGDTESLKCWFAIELEKAISESDEFEKLPDGKWRRVTLTN